jgi:demethylmenaquinone methyltransferase / 2-methoxy-6-polyprenyl-1,4-benzoquinol methylase
MTSTPPQPAPSTAVAWDDKLLQNPHAVADKQKRVQKMFAAIAPSYDLNNRVHSLWVDQYWRRKAVKLSNLKPTDRVVDVACGTGDLTIAFCRAIADLQASSTPVSERTREHPDPAGNTSVGSGSSRVRSDTGVSGSRDTQVVGIDYTFEMLPIARSKDAGIAFLNGDAQRLPLPDASADVVSIAFGIRNVADPAKAIREFYRVLRPGGRLIILEFSLPTNPVLRGMYNFYFRQILPRTATLISGDKSGAYKYLPESVNTFIGREQMQGMMSAAGFTDVSQHAMTFGVCICYRGVK